jgi:hypothetical protein
MEEYELEDSRGSQRQKPPVAAKGVKAGIEPANDLILSRRQYQ